MSRIFHRREKSGDNRKDAKSKPEKIKRTVVRLLEFRCRGKLLYSAKSDSLGEIVRIGRAPDNDWVIPEQDRVSADYQAKLRIGPREIKLQACGKNSIHLHGRAVSGCVLKINDRVAIGDCELFVKPAEISDTRPCDVHRLEALNGPKAGELIRLEKNLIRIGSAQDNDIVIEQDVVSRHHAEIRIAENGESWIRDLGSINGTFVNGDKLGRQERMLMDSDEFSIAFFDFLFLDRNVHHTRSQIGRKILVMGITLMVILGFFGIFYISTPQASQVLAATEFYIRRADFNTAKKLLDRMPESRDYQKYERFYKEHLKNIARYEKTFAFWNEFKGHLLNSEWEDAAECFGRLEIDNRFAWNWEDATVDERMALVQHAKALLDTLFKIRTLLASMDSEPEAQRTMLNELKKSPLLATPEADEPEWLKPLRQEIGQLMAELENNCNVLDQMNNALDQLKSQTADVNKLIADMENFRTVSSGSIRGRAQDLSDVLKQLEKNQREVSENLSALTNMRFEDIRQDIYFVSPDECMINAQIMQKRNQLVKQQKTLLRNAGDLKFLLEKMKNAGIGKEQIPVIVKNFASKEVIGKAFEFECLKGKMPNPRRQTPDGDYDRMFGIRYFYEMIQQSALLQNNLYSDDIVQSLEFKPECIALADLYRTVEETSLWLSMPENQWLIRDEIMKLKLQCENLMQQRTNMLAMLNQIAENSPDTRTYFVAKTAYFYFSPASTVPKEEMQKYAAAWKQFRAEQQATFEKYDPLNPEGAAGIKQTLLDNGIPGDPLVNWIWSLNNE